MSSNRVNITIAADASQAKREFGSLQKTTQGLGTQLNKLAAFAGVTGGLAGLGLAAKSAVGGFARFEQSIARAGAISRATAEEMELLTDTAREMGRTTQFRASEAAEALTFLSMAGFSVRDATAALPGVLQLAASAAIDLASAADIASNVMSGFGMDVSQLAQINDVLANAITSDNVSLTQLAESLKFVGPVAASAGVSLEEAASAIAIMGGAGIQGSMAGTALRGALSRLLNPSDEAAAIFNRLGVAIDETTIRNEGLAGVLKELEGVTLTTGDAMTIFGDRAGPGMLALISKGSGALEEMTEAVGATGTAANLADQQMNTLSGAFSKLQSAVESLSLQITNNDGSLQKWVEAAAVAVNLTEQWITKQDEAEESTSALGKSLNFLITGLRIDDFFNAWKDGRDRLVEYGRAQEEINRFTRAQDAIIEKLTKSNDDNTRATKEAATATDELTKQGDALKAMFQDPEFLLHYNEAQIQARERTEATLEAINELTEKGFTALQEQADEAAKALFDAFSALNVNLDLTQAQFDQLTDQQKAFLVQQNKLRTDTIMFGKAEQQAALRARMLSGELKILAMDMEEQEMWVRLVNQIMQDAEDQTISWAEAERLLKDLLPGATEVIKVQTQAAKEAAAAFKSMEASIKAAAEAQAQFAGRAPSMLPVTRGFVEPVASNIFSGMSLAQQTQFFQEQGLNKGVPDLGIFIDFFRTMVEGFLSTSIDRTDALLRAQRQIEGFDSGGVVSGPRGAPRLVVAHGGETILPTHRGGSGMGITINNDFAGATIIGIDDLEETIAASVEAALTRQTAGRSRR